MISKDSITLSVITSGGEIIRGVHLTEITSITNFTITFSQPVKVTNEHILLIPNATTSIRIK